MITVFPCYAAEERELALRLTEFLKNDGRLHVYFEEGQIRACDELAARVRDARAADVVLVFFSEHSVPPRWPRSEWEGPLFTEPAADGTRVGFLACGSRDPARVFQQNPRTYFDLRQDQTRQFRRLKRWILAPQFADLAELVPPDMEPLVLAAADRPGTVVLTGEAGREFAASFAARCAPDFESLVWVECGGRSMAALAGHLAWRYGIEARGETAATVEAVRAYGAGHRLLLVLAGGGEAAVALIPGGRTSTLLAGACDGCAHPYLEMAAHPVPAAEPPLCEDPVWAVTGRDAMRAARELGRFAEAYEIGIALLEEAQQAGDFLRARIAASDLLPIVEAWSREGEADRLRRLCPFEGACQLPLFGPEGAV